MAVTHSTGLRNFIIESGFQTAFDTNGRINFYTGIQPSPDAANTETLLATIVLAADAFAAAASGETVLNNVSSVLAIAPGTVGYAAFWVNGQTAMGSPAGGTDRRMYCSVGEGSGDISFDETAWLTGGTVALTNGGTKWTAPT